VVLKLKEVAVIKGGHPFPERLEPVADGAVSVIQMKDLPQGLRMESGAPARIAANGIRPRYLLQRGDLVFRSRGQVNTAVVLQVDLGNAVAAAPLMTIRAKREALLPDYLCWWIRQSVAQAYFDRHAKGSAGRMIDRTTLENLDIEIPVFAIQKQIADLALLGEREQELLTQLAVAEDIKLNRILMKTASRSKA
jgi:hypothetical protein